MPFRTSPVVDEDDWLLRLEVDDGIGVLTLDHPDKLNAWSWEASRQLGARADQIRFDDDIRVVVLKGNGRAFCAGIDLGMPEDRVTGRSPAEKVPELLRGHPLGPRAVPGLLRAAATDRRRGPRLLPRLRFRARADVRRPAGRRQRDLRPPGGDDRCLDRRRWRPPAGPRARGRLGQVAGDDRPADHAATAERLGIVQQVTEPMTSSRRPWPSPARSPATPRSPSSRSSGRSTRSPTAAWPRRSSSRRISASVEFVSDDMPAGYAAKASQAARPLRGQVGVLPNRRRPVGRCCRRTRSPGRPPSSPAAGPGSARLSRSSSPGPGAAVGILSRSDDHRRAGVAAVEAVGGRAAEAAADIREPDQVAAAFDRLEDELGPVPCSSTTRPPTSRCSRPA